MLFERIAGKSKKKSEGQQTIPYLQTIIINAYFCIEFGSPSKIKPLLFWVLYDIVLKTEDILVLVYLVVLAVLGFFCTYLHLKKARKSSHLFLPRSLRTRSKKTVWKRFVNRIQSYQRLKMKNTSYRRVNQRYVKLNTNLNLNRVS